MPKSGINFLAFLSTKDISDLSSLLEKSEIGKKGLEELKFVIDNKNADESLKEIKELIKELPKCEVYLMTMGENVQELTSNEVSVINLCINNSFIYSDRLHIRLWNDKRGV